MRGGGSRRVNDEEGIRLARETVAKIQAIDPDEGTADAWLAWFAFYYDFDLVTGAFHLQRMLMANPADAKHLRDSMQMLSTLGYLDEAVAIGEYVVANDPLCTFCQYRLARAYRLAGKLDDAEAAIHAALILVDPGRYPIQRDLGRVLALKGESQEALEVFKEAGHLEGVAVALYDLGRQEQFETVFSDFLEQSANVQPEDVAYVYAWIGDADAAFEYLEKQFEQQRSVLSRIVRYPVFNSLHEDPRWIKLLQKLGMSPEQLAGIDFKLPPMPGINLNKQ